MHFKGLLFILLTFLIKLSCYGQSNELQLKAFLNKSSFIGSGAAIESHILSPYDPAQSPYVDNPYGVIGKYRFNLGLSFQRNTQSNLLFGIGSSFEKLSSRVRSKNGMSYNNKYLDGKGNTILSLNYASIHPFIGVFITKETTKIEFKIVSDISYLIQSKEILTFETEEETYKFYHHRDHPNMNYRFGLGSAVYVHRFAIHIEYLIGTVNFDPEKGSPLVDVIEPIYSQLFRLGVGYIILDSNSKKNEKL